MRKENEQKQAPAQGAWPPWAKGVVSAILGFHMLAVLAGALAAYPSSELQRALAGKFQTYHQVLDQGYSYRYYVAGPPPTPIVRARLALEGGQVEELRIPDREQGPRLRFQRHLALAYHLFEDFRAAPRDASGQSQSRWARSYARHLCQTRPGCMSVTLYLQMHRNPTPEELIDAAARGEVVDVESSRYYTVPERIGVYSCDDF